MVQRGQAKAVGQQTAELGLVEHGLVPPRRRSNGLHRGRHDGEQLPVAPRLYDLDEQRPRHDGGAIRGAAEHPEQAGGRGRPDLVFDRRAPEAVELGVGAIEGAPHQGT